MDRRYKKRIDRYWFECEKRFMNMLAKQLNPNTWFDMWHYHYDPDNKGNRDINRYASNLLGYKMLLKTEEFCKLINQPNQCFLMVNEDVNDDAIYIHTENPNVNGTKFPYEFLNAEWGARENELLNQIVNTETHKIGKITYENSIYFAVVKKT